jgi:hypothetical protein
MLLLLPPLLLVVVTPLRLAATSVPAPFTPALERPAPIWLLLLLPLPPAASRPSAAASRLHTLRCTRRQSCWAQRGLQ